MRTIIRFFTCAFCAIALVQTAAAQFDLECQSAELDQAVQPGRPLQSGPNSPLYVDRWNRDLSRVELYTRESVCSDLVFARAYDIPPQDTVDLVGVGPWRYDFTGDGYYEWIMSYLIDDFENEVGWFRIVDIQSGATLFEWHEPGRYVNEISIEDVESDGDYELVVLSGIYQTGTFRYYVYNTGLTTGDVETPVAPADFDLRQNFPNPFNPSTQIPFSLSRSSVVDMDIYNVLGEKVSTVKAGTMPAGEHRVFWNGTTGSGRVAPSGSYFYQMKVDGKPAGARKMLMVR